MCRSTSHHIRVLVASVTNSTQYVSAVDKPSPATEQRGEASTSGKRPGSILAHKYSSDTYISWLSKISRLSAFDVLLISCEV